MWDAISRAAGRTPGPLRGPVETAVATFRFYDEDRCPTYAAAIAYYAIFSVIPLVLIIVSTLGILIDRDEIVNFIFEQVPLEQTESVERNVIDAVQQAQSISPVSLVAGILTLVWASSGIFGAVRRGLNATSRRPGQSYLHGKAIDILLVPLIGLVVLLSFVLTAAAQALLDALANHGWDGLREVAPNNAFGLILPPMLTFGMFLLLYRFVPSARARWRDAAAGALFASILFEVTKFVAAWLIGRAAYSRDTALYAGLGTALAFLFWAYLSASILLLGAEFARALAPTRDKQGHSAAEDATAGHEAASTGTTAPGSRSG